MSAEPLTAAFRMKSWFGISVFNFRSDVPSLKRQHHAAWIPIFLCQTLGSILGIKLENAACLLDVQTIHPRCQVTHALKSWGYSRYSVNKKVGYRRKEQGKMDLHLIRNWEENPVKNSKKITVMLQRKGNAHKIYVLVKQKLLLPYGCRCLQCKL